jgi:hypothetical protein
MNCPFSHFVYSTGRYSRTAQNAQGIDASKCHLSDLFGSTHFFRTPTLLLFTGPTYASLFCDCTHSGSILPQERRGDQNSFLLYLEHHLSPPSVNPGRGNLAISASGFHFISRASCPARCFWLRMFMGFASLYLHSPHHWLSVACK